MEQLDYTSSINYVSWCSETEFFKEPFVLVQKVFFLPRPNSSFHHSFTICVAKVIWLSLQGIMSPKTIQNYHVISYIIE